MDEIHNYIGVTENVCKLASVRKELGGLTL